MQLIRVEAALVREAKDADVAAVDAVLRAANAQFAHILPPALYRAYLANVLDIRGRLDESRLLVAEHEGRIVGTITLYPDASREGWGWPSHWTGIRAVAVAPSARGLGIGRALAVTCIERSRALGALAVCLHTASFMGAAVAMYERLGFRRLPEFDHDVGSMFAAGTVEPPIVARAYRLDLVA
jgi:predicted N-acetyltransferase YhbS